MERINKKEEKRRLARIMSFEFRQEIRQALNEINTKLNYLVSLENEDGNMEEIESERKRYAKRKKTEQ